MNADRFAALARAYGADLERWPEVERGAAQGFLAAEPAAAERVLETERALDAALHAAPQSYPSHALRERVLASAAVRPAPRPAALRRRIGWLAPGAGLAAACVAGAWLGVFASHTATSQLRADTVLVASADQSAGGDPDDSGSL